MKNLIYILVLFVLLVDIGFAQNLESGCVGNWPFTGNANDVSGNGNNGTVYGASLTMDRFGNPNSAYYFNGTNNYIEVPSSNSLLLTNAFTISAFAKVDTLSFSRQSAIVSKIANDGWYGGYELLSYIGNVFAFDGNISGNNIWIDHGPYLSNNWYLINITYNGNYLKLYVNGILKDSTSIAGSLQTSTTTLRFGRRGGAGGNSIWFKGTVDDIRLYNRALSQAEIRLLFGLELNHTPLSNSEQTTGTRAVNCTIIPSGSNLNPSLTKLFYAKDDTTFTGINLTFNGGTNWSANLPLTGAGIYNYYLTATDSISRTATAPVEAPANYYSFTAALDTVKPVIITTPLVDYKKSFWPATVTATATDYYGIDSVWVKWYKNNTGTGIQQFKLLNTGGNNYATAFNSTQADVVFNDSIFYRVFARDMSSGHLTDSTALYKFKIIKITLHEGFEGTFPPQGWRFSNFSQGNRPFYGTKNIQNPSTPWTSSIITPKILIMTSDTLSFYMADFVSGNWSRKFNITVQLATNDSNSFTTIASTGDYWLYFYGNYVKYQLPLSNCAGQSGWIKIIFTQYAQWNLYVDEIFIGNNPPIYSPPTLSSPNNGSINVSISPTLSWNGPTNATKYELQVATDATFNNLIVNDSNRVTNVYIISPGILLNNTTYYWRVRAKNDNFITAYTSTWQFTTIVSLPISPLLISPTNDAQNQPLSPIFFTWNSVPTATSYDIQFARDSLFGTIIFQESNIAVTNYTFQNSSLLFLNTQYFWRVRARNIAGIGPFSNPYKFTTLLNTQSYWTWQYPIPQGNTINSLHFVNSSTGWSVGDGGFIVKTTNGGNSWTNQSLNIPRSLKYVNFIDQNTGWIVGQLGTILKTINGGYNWTNLDLGTSYNLNCIKFTTSNEGWISGDNGIMYKTTDAGVTWQIKSTGTTANMNSLFFFDSNIGWACGSGTNNILRTIDGGDSWILTNYPSNNFSSVFFSAYYNGWIGYNGGILKTIDGGYNWTASISGVNTKSIFFVNDNTGFASCVNGIYSTSNAGTNWVFQKLDSNNFSYNSVLFTDNNTGYSGGTGGTLIKTINGGTNWNKISNAINQTLNSISFIDQNSGWSIGNNGTILKTTNSGTNWNAQTSGTTSVFYQTKFYNNLTGWICGQGGLIIKTTNSGSNWSTLVTGTTNTLKALHFLDGNTGWAAGINGTIIKTSLGGLFWTTQNTTSGDSISSINFINLNTGWASVRQGKIYKTTNSGTNWTPFTTGISSYKLNDIKFKNANNGWIGCDGGKILYTSDGGSNWSLQELGITNNLISLSIADSLNLWAVGSDGAIVKTTNSGANWSIESTPTNNGLNSVFFVNSSTGWAAGLNGTIIKTNSILPPAPIALTYPNGGENLSSGTVCNITWTSIEVTNLKIEYTTNNGVNWNTIVESTPASTGNYNWTIPAGLSSTNCKIKLINLSDVNLCSVSNNVFRIYTLSAPTQVNLLQPANTSANQPLIQTFRWSKAYDQSNNQLKTKIKSEIIQKELKSDSKIKKTKDLSVSKEKGTDDKTNKTRYKEESQTDNISNYWFELVRDTVTMSNLLRDSVLADTVKLVSSLENLKDYYWRVKAKNEIGWGSFSLWSKFTTVSQPDFSHSAVPPSGSNSTTTFGATDITFNANVSIPANVTVAYYSVPPVNGELPAGILSVSQYYWIIQDLGIEFSDGLFKIPLSAIGGVSDPSKLVFLKRSNAGDNWINIGGVIQDGYLVNTIPFTSFSEFAIASQDAQPLQNSYISITVIPQGFYDAVLNRLNMRDTVTALLRSVDSPYSLIDSARGVIDSLTFTIKFGFKIAPTGTYYIVIKHRNSLETWCKSGGVAFTKYATINYDFTSSIMQAYGDNMILKGSRVCIYSGDINQDGSVDASDRSSVWNDRNKTGYEASDVDGSGVVDALDRSLVWNNRNLITEKPFVDNFNMKQKKDKRDKEIKNIDIKGKEIKKDKQNDNDLKLDGSKKKTDNSNTKNDGPRKSDGSNSQTKNKSK